VRAAADGTWSTSETSPFGAGASGGYYHTALVYESELYAVVFHNHGTPRMVVRKFDGTTWSQVYDIEASQTSVTLSGQAVLYKNDMWLVVPDSGSSTAVTLKNTSGTWSEVDTGTALRSYLAVSEVAS